MAYNRNTRRVIYGASDNKLKEPQNVRVFGATRPYPTVGYPSNAPEKTDTDQLPPIFFVTKLGQAKDKNSI